MRSTQSTKNNYVKKNTSLTPVGGETSNSICTDDSGMAMNSVTINQSVDTHIGNTTIVMSQAEKVTFIIKDSENLETSDNTIPTQIIQDIILQDLEKKRSDLKMTQINKKTLLCQIILGTLFIVLSTIVLIFILTRTHSVTRNNNTNVTKIDSISQCERICVVKRDHWGWVPTKKNCLSLQANHIRVTLLYQICTNMDQCSTVVKGFQNVLDYNTLLPINKSIQYNFIIGGDERIYISRGWDCGWKELFNIAIVFNNYSYQLTENQIYLFLLLIHVGRRCGYIEESFEFKLSSDCNCDLADLYENLVRSVGLLKRNIYRVKDFQIFMEDSDLIRNYDCLQPSNTYKCTTVTFRKDNLNESFDFVECKFK